MTVLARLKVLLGITGAGEDALLTLLLDIAGQAVLNKAYPYDPTVLTVPIRYESVQLDIAQYLYNKRGAEGQTAHSENGISRSYEEGGVPKSMLRDVVPHVGTVITPEGV